MSLSRSDTLALEQAVALFEISPNFREQFERNSLHAIREAAAARRIASLSPAAERSLALWGAPGIYDLAKLLDSAWA